MLHAAFIFRPLSLTTEWRVQTDPRTVVWTVPNIKAETLSHWAALVIDIYISQSYNIDHFHKYHVTISLFFLTVHIIINGKKKLYLLNYSCCTALIHCNRIQHSRREAT